MAAACSTSRRAARPSKTPARAPTPRSIASTGPKASAAGTSAGACWAAKEPALSVCRRRSAAARDRQAQPGCRSGLLAQRERYRGGLVVADDRERNVVARLALLERREEVLGRLERLVVDRDDQVAQADAAHEVAPGRPQPCACRRAVRIDAHHQHAIETEALGQLVRRERHAQAG